MTGRTAVRFCCITDPSRFVQLQFLHRANLPSPEATLSDPTFFTVMGIILYSLLFPFISSRVGVYAKHANETHSCGYRGAHIDFVVQLWLSLCLVLYLIV